MHGEQISANVQKGWVAMCYHGFVVGGAKSDGHALKNKYPKAFRTRQVYMNLELFDFIEDTLSYFERKNPIVSFRKYCSDSFTYTY